MALPLIDKPAEAASSSPDIVKLLMASKLYLIAGLLAGLGIGAAVYWKAGPAYQAVAEVLVSRRSSPLKDERDQTVGERGEHIALIMTPLIVGNAVRKSELQKLPSLRNEADPVAEILTQLKVRRISGTDRSHTNLLEIS